MAMEPVRYTKEELLSWQEASEVEGQWESIVDCIDARLFQELCTAHHHRRNTDRRQRPHPITHPPLFVQPAESLNNEDIFSVNASLDDGCQYMSEEEDAFEDSDEEVSLQPVAFLVEGEPDFESGPPQDGFEYLRRVMWETARCPKVKIAKIDEKKLLLEQTKYMPEISPIPTCSSNLLPSKNWVQTFLKDFSNLRAVLCNSSASDEVYHDELPLIRKKSVWKSLCFGKGRSSDGVSDEQEDGDVASMSLKESVCKDVACFPYLRILLRLDEISRATLFRYHVAWLKEHDNLAYDRATWLFALAAVIGSPLDDQTSAAFRDLLRKCAELRMEKNEDDEELYMLNILITIAGEYFGQAEHSDV